MRIVPNGDAIEAGEVDIIVVSDHGMTQRSRERAIFLDDHVALTELDVAHWGPYLSATPTTRHVRPPPSARARFSPRASSGTPKK